MNIEQVEGWGKAQTLFNFHEWLNKDKKYFKSRELFPNVFDIADDQLDALWDEFLSIYRKP